MRPEILPALALFAPLALAQTERARLVPEDRGAGEVFAYSLALDGATMIAGAAFDYHSGFAAPGSAYVFEPTAGLWLQTAKLVAPDLQDNALFGTSVAIDGDTLVIGAPNYNLGPTADIGTAYVFRRTLVAWEFSAQLFASDAAATDLFGGAVAVVGDRIVVGASSATHTGLNNAGAAYVFERSADVWQQTARLVALDPHADDLFAASVAVSANRILVGARAADTPLGLNRGAAYVFEPVAARWQQTAQLYAFGGESGDRFGNSVSLAADRIAIGAPYRDLPGAGDAGAAYVFELEPLEGIWHQRVELISPDPHTADRFGISVSIDRRALLVGAFNDDTPAGADAGAAYLYHHGPTGWQFSAAIEPSGAAAGNVFGWAVHLQADTAAIASPFEDGNRGAAYLIAGMAGACAADLNRTGVVDLEDLAILLSNFSTPTGATPEQGDLDGDADVDLADLAALISTFGADCS